MKKNWLIVFAAALALILVGLILRGKLFSRPGLSALSISTTPKATVFIDNIQVGTTPFLNEKVKFGEHTIRLVPETTTGELVPWEGNVNLTPNILTVINRTLSSTEAASSGMILWLEKINSSDKSLLSVVSIPDQAVLRVDDAPKGFAPVILEDISVGSHQLVVSSTGFEEKTISIKTVAGYKLVVNVQLAQKIEGIAETESITPTPSSRVTPSPKITPTPPKNSPTPKVTPKTTLTPPERPYVEIKETPTGWLRVRAEPSTQAEELGKLYPGDTAPYLNEEKTGWYKIEYQSGKEGWISKTYADLIE